MSNRRSKGLAGLDEHQVRRRLPWRRWTLLAHALLAALTAAEREHRRAERGLMS